MRPISLQLGFLFGSLESFHSYSRGTLTSFKAPYCKQVHYGTPSDIAAEQYLGRVHKITLECDEFLGGI